MPMWSETSSQRAIGVEDPRSKEDILKPEGEAARSYVHIMMAAAIPQGVGLGRFGRDASLEIRLCPYMVQRG